MKKIFSFIIIGILINTFLLSSNLSVFANTATESDLTNTKFNVNEYLNNKKTQDQNYFSATKCTTGPISCFVLTALDFATEIIGSIAVILLIISGFMMMLAQGNDTKLSAAKDITKYAIIGLIITFSSYIITIFIQGIFTSRS